LTSGLRISHNIGRVNLPNSTLRFVSSEGDSTHNESVQPPNLSDDGAGGGRRGEMCWGGAYIK